MIFFSFVIIFIQYFIVGMALRCYQCNSETHRRCLSEERLLDKFLLECPPSRFNLSGIKPIPFCSKINQWLYITKKKRVAVIRSCNYYHKFKDKCELHSDRDSHVSVCLCGTDGCNSARKRRPISPLFALQIFLYNFLFMSLFPT